MRTHKNICARPIDLCASTTCYVPSQIYLSFKKHEYTKLSDLIHFTSLSIDYILTVIVGGCTYYKNHKIFK